MEAIRDVLWCSSPEHEKVCKTVQFLSEPSIDVLTLQLQILSLCYQSVVGIPDDVDINFDDDNVLEMINHDLGVQEAAQLCEHWLRFQILKQCKSL